MGHLVISACFGVQVFKETFVVYKDEYSISNDNFHCWNLYFTHVLNYFDTLAYEF